MQGLLVLHHNDVMMDVIASQITSLAIVYSTVYSGWDQREHQSSTPLAFVRGLHRTGEFPAQMASNAENFSIFLWRHHDTLIAVLGSARLVHAPRDSPRGPFVPPISQCTVYHA